jgi:hypothetical protein
MSTNETRDDVQHKIIFADRDSITPNENDLHIKQLWIDVYNENLNEGAVQSNGNILWDCPCLGTQAIGPCSSQFRAAFSCYQSSTKEPKGKCLQKILEDCNINFISFRFGMYGRIYENAKLFFTIS